jgi:hypothetical protein
MSTYNALNHTEQGGAHTVIGGAISYPNIETKDANFTVTREDSGKTFVIDAADVVATLPATEEGLVFTFYVAAVSAVTGFSVSPQAADKFIKGAKADDADLVNTQATEAIGDNVTVMGDGADGWLVLKTEGTWA